LCCIRDIVQTDAAQLSATLALEAASARIEVQCLLQQTLKVARSYLLAHPEQILSPMQFDEYVAMLQRRLQGEPIAYILEEREFFGLNLKVSPATLIPRPETELLVELALKLIAEGQPMRVLDLGTGSGAIALSIARARPATTVIATDVSEAALKVARENAEKLGISNVSFVHSDWFSALDGQCFDLVVSNPPYIAKGDAHLAQGDVRFEPLSALVSGADGLDAVRQLTQRTGRFLELGGNLLLEHGYDQAVQVRELLQLNRFEKVFSAKDIAGVERVSGGSYKK